MGSSINYFGKLRYNGNQVNAVCLASALVISLCLSVDTSRLYGGSADISGLRPEIAEKRLHIIVA